VKTENIDPSYAELDLMPTPELVRVFMADQLNALNAALAASDQVAAAIEAAVPRLQSGGRLLYFGAGTSGRLALLDSVELGPTFSWPKERAVASLAGGAGAVYVAVEGAEDSEKLGIQDFLAQHPTERDVVICVAASGRTPYTIAVLREARRCGALTVALVNNPESVMISMADHPVVIDTGAEVIAGSTRLKAGTAQKIVLNTLSSGIMVKLEKVYANLMVDVRATNEKLVHRAVGLTARVAEVDEARAKAMLMACSYEVKTAIVALRCGIDVAAARARLASLAGSVRRALAQP
jgi:N-acetylmuramic acid 6-phosphate etherase